MTSDRPLLGILLMLGFCVLAPLGDALAKVIGQAVPLIVLLIIRFAVQLIILQPLARTRVRTLSPQTLRLIWIRAALHIIGIGAMFTALQHLPLADAVAIAFVMPFIMLALGHFVLGEEIGIRRWTACAVGFCGTLLVVQPAFQMVGYAALLPLLVAVVFSLFMLVTRSIKDGCDPISLQAINGWMALALLLPIAGLGAFTDIAALQMVLPDVSWAPYLLGIGIVGTAAHLFMTYSLRFAPAATLAPMQYLEIPFATLIGWLIFEDFPNTLAALGIMITMAAGLFVILSERAKLAAQPTVREPQP